MYYNEFIENLKEEEKEEEKKTMSRVIQYRRRGDHKYRAGILIPVYVHNDTLYIIHSESGEVIAATNDIYIIGSWPISDIVKAMSILYTIQGEIIGEV